MPAAEDRESDEYGALIKDHHLPLDLDGTLGIADPREHLLRMLGQLHAGTGSLALLLGERDGARARHGRVHGLPRHVRAVPAIPSHSPRIEHTF